MNFFVFFQSVILVVQLHLHYQQYSTRYSLLFPWRKWCQARLRFCVLVLGEGEFELHLLFVWVSVGVHPISPARKRRLVVLSSLKFLCKTLFRFLTRCIDCCEALRYREEFCFISSERSCVACMFIIGKSTPRDLRNYTCLRVIHHSPFVFFHSLTARLCAVILKLLPSS